MKKSNDRRIRYTRYALQNALIVCMQQKPFNRITVREICETVRRGASLAAATVRGLILTVSHKEQIGELYPQVLETLVYGACRELFE